VVRPLRRLLARFRRNESGVAAVEFALILPFLIALYMGSIEASSLFTVDRRIDVISNTTADLVSRWNSGTSAIPSNTLRDYFRASAGIITPYSTTGLKQVVSLLQVSSAGVAKVVWSCAYNGGTSLAINSEYALGDDMKNVAKGGYLVAATAKYSYKPVLGMVFTSAIDLENEALFFPRFGAAVTAPSGGCPT
jgi:Flp pilus assembly protein TadG